MTLVEFLTARLDEDEQAARECGGAPWSAPIPGMVHVDAKAIADNKLAWGQLGYVATVEREHDRQHIARHDPARVLREVEAKRRIIEECEPGFNPPNAQAKYTAETVLQCLALPYADHPDYDEDWRP
ncbi:DUF6221 family protein [Streptomyces sp.]|uniref:DUF6221 family protein n=1 Tax=Streptomyces sp. TaxID=1931 RepID=UPI002F93C995